MEAILSGIASFAIFHYVSHPKSKIHGKMPSAKFKRVQVFPRFNIETKNRVFHFHHWLVITPIFVGTQFVSKGVLSSDVLHGFMLGGIVQGLLYKDSLKFVHRPTEFQQKVMDTSYHGFSTIKRIFN